MKRRRALQTLAGIPALTALPLPARPQTNAAAASGPPELRMTVAEAAAAAVPRFFTPAELSTLRSLCLLLMPGALEAETPEFLDFLIAASPAERQTLYRNGLQQLDAAATDRYSRHFPELSASEADPLLGALRQSWTYRGPSDPLARFLVTARDDILTATVNSREYGSGRAAMYWFQVE